MAKESDEPIGVVKAAASVYKHRSKKRVLLTTTGAKVVRDAFQEEWDM